MPEILSNVVAGHQDIGLIVASHIEQAVNDLFPHTNDAAKYVDAGEIGIAIVVADEGVVSLDPFSEPKPRTALHYSNQLLRPKAWVTLEADEGMLGGIVEGLGRLSAFALAKGNGMLDDKRRSSSYNPQGVNLGRGKVGLPGGRRLNRSLVLVSGGASLHDHILGKVYADEVLRVYTTKGEPLSRDQIAEVIAERIQVVRSITKGHPVDQIEHVKLGDVLSQLPKAA